MAARDTPRPLIDISALPDISKEDIDFHDTSFFRPNPCPQLPTPASVLQQCPEYDNAAGVVKFEHLNLAVKFGFAAYLRLEEAQTMIAIKQAFPHDDIPVPEVFGWRRYKNRNFIYMSLVRGQTLREAWPSLTQADKKSVSGELARIVAALRRISQGPSNRFIGSINGGTVQDRFFKLDYEKGPFLTIESFNDWLLAAATRQKPGPEGIVTGPDLYREFFTDTGNIYFTHGDLTLGNIIVSGSPDSYRIVGIIDWEQAGWYPEYWEYCKLLFGVSYTHEWRSAGWADTVMESYEDEWTAFIEYCLWRNP